MRVQIVSFHCVLKNKLGQFISSSFNQDVTTSSLSPQSPLLPGFVEALKNLKQTDPDHASVEKAESRADMMQIFSRMIVEEYEKELLKNSKDA